MSGKLKPMGMFGVCGVGIGAILGGIIGGPGAALEGAKACGAFGVQAALLSKADGALDAAGKKAEEAVDKTTEALDKIGNRVAVALESIADDWSKIILCGCAMNVALSISYTGMKQYNEMCTSFFQNLDCATLSSSSAIANISTALICMSMTYKIHQMLGERNVRRSNL